MITKVKVINHVSMLFFATQYRIPAEAYVISISSPGDDPIFPEDTDKIISLQFDDIDPYHCDPQDKERLRPITDAQATLIVNHLLKAHRAPSDHPVWANCAAGIARSGAVGTVAHRMAGISYYDFRAENPMVQPNGYILQQLTRAWRRREEAL